MIVAEWESENEGILTEKLVIVQTISKLPSTSSDPPVQALPKES